jgi:hypothetical protein
VRIVPAATAVSVGAAFRTLLRHTNDCKIARAPKGDFRAGRAFLWLTAQTSLGTLPTVFFDAVCQSGFTNPILITDNVREFPAEAYRSPLIFSM